MLVQVKDEEDSVCLISSPWFPYQVYMLQGYEDDPEPDDEEDEDASYADEEYGSTKKKAPKKKKQPSKPRGACKAPDAFNKAH